MMSKQLCKRRIADSCVSKALETLQLAVQVCGRQLVIGTVGT